MKQVMCLFKVASLLTHLATGQPCGLLPSLPVWMTFSRRIAVPLNPVLQQHKVQCYTNITTLADDWCGQTFQGHITNVNGQGSLMMLCCIIF